MAKQYNLGFSERSANALFRGLTRLGMGARNRHVLTVRGRKTGKAHSTPVDVMDVGGARWLVAPYGVVGWVRNARVAGRVELARGGKREQFGLEEVGADEAVPVIREYIRDVPVTKSYWDCRSDATDAELAAQVPAHPVFRLTSVPS